MVIALKDKAYLQKQRKVSMGVRGKEATPRSFLKKDVYAIWSTTGRAPAG